jgi:putative nucleotidyltransferase with HDIG domain
MKTRILFVDDEPQALDALQHTLRPMQNQWEMTFVESGAAALELMGTREFDVLLTDMSMPNMNGAQLLCETMNRHPHTVRFIMSAESDKEMTMQCAAAAHQFLVKPCKLETLIAAITRAIAVESRLKDESLRHLLAQMPTLPAVPAVYAELIARLKEVDAPLDGIGEIIGRDIAMTAKVLQLVNSAFFGLRRRVQNPTEAVNVLGIETVKALVVWTQTFSQFRTSSLRDVSLENLSTHSLSTATLAREIMISLPAVGSSCEEAFTAGLLHDVGKLVLAARQTQKFRLATMLSRRESIPLCEAERHVFGVSHAEVGAYLLGLWGLPLGIVEAAALHHAPGNSGAQGVTALTAVHIANALEAEFSGCHAAFAAPLDMEYLTAVGVADRIDGWRKELRELVPGPIQEAA